MASQDGYGKTVRGPGSGNRGGGTINTATGGSGAAMSAGAPTGGSDAGLTSGGGGRGGSAGDFSMRLAGIEARLSTMEMGARAGQLSFSSMIDGDLKVYDLLGELKMKIGIQSDGKPGITYQSGVAPPTPSDPDVGARQLSFVVGWDGTFADGVPTPSDVARVDVHVGPDDDYDPDATTAVGSLYAAGLMLLPGDIEDAWVRLVAVSMSGVPSSPTPAVWVRPLPASSIAADSIAAIHLAAEIVLSTTIIAGDPAAAHIELNSTGLRMMRADMTPTVVFSAEEGNALITGSIQTALAGSGKARIVFNPFPELDWNEIRFYAPGDQTWSSLFATKDRNGNPGSVGIQGYQNLVSKIVLASVYGEDHLLSGVFSLIADQVTGQNTLSDGMLVSPIQTGLVGSGGPFLLHNHKRPAIGANPIAGALDPFIGFMNQATAAVNGTSVLEFHEQSDLPQGYAIVGLRNLGVNMGLYFGDEDVNDVGQRYVAGRFAFKAYNFRSQERYVPIATAGLATTSSRELKSDIDPIGDHVDPLAVIDAVDPVRFRFTDPEPDPVGSSAVAVDGTRTLLLPDMMPPEPEDAGLMTTDLADARERMTDDGLIPITLPPAPPRGSSTHYYGVIAEELAAAAPDAIVYGGAGPMIDQSSMNGLLWAAVKKLAAKVDAIETADPSA